MKKNYKIKMVAFLLLVGIIVTSIKTNSLAEIPTDAIRDKETNTAYITKKTAKWTNEQEYLAELELAVNGTEYTEPIDVIIALDRSGSMGMDYVHDLLGQGTHNASSPCLNQEHFYLRETSEVVTTAPSADISEMFYDELANTLTVYNEEKGKWVILDTSNKIHFYFMFTAETLDLGAYHFKMENGEFKRISKWNTVDVRKGTNSGTWDHADEEEGCYGRWIEAKKAVSAFTKQLLDDHSENTIALVPFSMRDSAINHSLNNFMPNTRDWLIDEGKLPSNGLLVEANGTVSGKYNSIVDWTRNYSDVENMLSSLFMTGSTDYMYSLSQTYNLLDNRSDEDKANKKAVVIFLSDGIPDPAGGTLSKDGVIYAFYNGKDDYIYGLSDAIKAPLDETVEGEFWQNISGQYQRHDVDPAKLITGSGGEIIGAKGQNAELITVGYMLDSEAGTSRLKKMASYEEDYINIPANAKGSTSDYLTEQLLNSTIFPGARNAVLKDEVSKYFYVPEEAVLPEGVTVEGDIETGQTIVWDIGSIYHYKNEEDEPNIKVPLVLREEYRNVPSTIYYPTNNDNPEPDLTTSENGPDGKDTGAKLYYDDTEGIYRYDTIGTPKLPVKPKNVTPEDPTHPEDPTQPDESTEPSNPITTTEPQEEPTGSTSSTKPVEEDDKSKLPKTGIIETYTIGIATVAVGVYVLRKKNK